MVVVQIVVRRAIAIAVKEEVVKRGTTQRRCGGIVDGKARLELAVEVCCWKLEIELFFVEIWQRDDLQF